MSVPPSCMPRGTLLGQNGKFAQKRGAAITPRTPSLAMPCDQANIRLETDLRTRSRGSRAVASQPSRSAAQVMNEMIFKADLTDWADSARRANSPAAHVADCYEGVVDTFV